MAEKYDELAAKFGVSREAVDVLARALAAGRGKLAQFNHPELGGMGQWMPGMVMVGDMFNHALKAKVEGLCVALMSSYGTEGFPKTPSMPGMERWWPADLGNPSQAGAQNDSHYAIFPDKKRLAVKRGDLVRVYDTGSHRITGVAQQQSNLSQHLVFSTPNGPVSETDFELVEP